MTIRIAPTLPALSLSKEAQPKRAQSKGAGASFPFDLAVTLYILRGERGSPCAALCPIVEEGPESEMSRIALLALFVVALTVPAVVATAPALAQDQPNFYAVVIGISQFSQLPKEEWLEYAHSDASDFYKFITSPRGRAFSPDNVFLLTNEQASFQAIRSRLGSTLAKKIKPEDTVYIFIATHGMVEKEAAREGYLLAHDSDREDLYSSAMPMRELGNIMSNRLKNARRVFLFADACRAGKLGQTQWSVNRYIEDVSKQRGEVVGLLASRPNEFSREGKQFGGGHGVFTYHLLKGLMGAADAD